MNSSKVISNLEDILKSLEREKESLKHLLLSGKISHGTFNLLEKRIERTAALASELERALREEESFWRETLLGGIKVFETLLVEFEHKRLLGMIGNEEYSQNSEILSMGLNSIKSQMEQNIKAKEKTVALSQPSNRESAHNETGNDPEQPHENQSEKLTRKDRRATKTMPKDERRGISEFHCMNPWNPECRNTDIEVSIYYDGRMVPICHRCWEEIANRDVEWSSL